MPDNGNLIALFLVGLLGGTHCVGMCGGIIGALSLGGPARLSLHLAYNIGRIASYCAAGAIAGMVGGASLAVAGELQARIALYLLANLMLIALGIYLMGITSVLAWVERAGSMVWRRIQPATKRFLPVRTAVQAFPLGLLWGWLPCGLVYSALTTALTSGSMVSGAHLMLAFGLGTLPNLLLAGLFLGRLRSFTQHRAVRLGAGSLVTAYGVYGLYATWNLVR